MVNNGFVGLRTFEAILRYYDLHASQRLVTNLDAVKDSAGGKQRGRPSGNKRPRPETGGDAANATEAPAVAALPVQMLTVAKPAMDARGHTGYLTVARKAVHLVPSGNVNQTPDD